MGEWKEIQLMLTEYKEMRSEVQSLRTRAARADVLQRENLILTKALEELEKRLGIREDPSEAVSKSPQVMRPSPEIPLTPKELVYPKPSEQLSPGRGHRLASSGGTGQRPSVYYFI